MKTAYIKSFFLFLYILSCSSKCKLENNEKITINNQIEKLVIIDQIASSIPKGKFENYSKEEWIKYQDSIYLNNKQIVESLFNKYGFLGINEVGENGAENFWLLIQHFDKFPRFQTKMLRKMKIELKKKNVLRSNYAYLSDRINANSGKKQIFGTQVVYNDKGRAVVKNGLIDSININNLRKKYDLENLKDYLNRMTESHFRMNEKYFQKKGITKPSIYK